MLDLLPYIDIKGQTPQEKTNEIVEYLVRLKDELEFVLTNISEENLSPSLRKKLSETSSDLESDSIADK